MFVKLCIWLALTGLGFHASARRSKHRARDRARFYIGAGRHFISGAGGVGSVMPASVLVEQLRKERERWRFA
jgi:hypothetical protein